MFSITIKPTGFPPLPHDHPELSSNFNSIKSAYAGASDRFYPPFCRITQNSNFIVANSTDTWIGGLWTTVHDNASMVKQPGVTHGSSDSTKLRIIVPISGFYRVSFKYYMDGLGSSVANACITLNNATSVTTGALVMAQGAANGWASPTATDVVYLAAEDRLYFSCWQNSGAGRTMFATWFGSAKSSITAQWIGR